MSVAEVLTGVVALLTVFIVVLTYLILVSYLKIEWFTGSMETYSQVMLRIEAAKGINGQPVKLLWWDPTIAELPVKRVHGQEIDTSTVYIFLPPNKRQKKGIVLEKGPASIHDTLISTSHRGPNEGRHGHLLLGLCEFCANVAYKTV